MMKKQTRGISNWKRIFDLIISTLLLVILSPFWLLIFFLLLIVQGPPVFFCQERPGKDGKVFRLCKFRTMHRAKTEKTSPDSDDARITKFGAFLRRSSLDEIPELFNVIRGEMSLVGPRPLLIQYLDRYTAEQARRHNVLPGITGWAQVNGRNAISWEEKFKLDVWYIDNWSFWLDIRILLMTIGKALSGEGLSQPGRATMDEFMGGDQTGNKL